MDDNYNGSGWDSPELPDISDYSAERPLIATNKRGESFPVYPGGRYKLLASGAVQDTVTTKFVAVHSSNWNYSNPEQARESALLRWRAARQAVFDRLGVLAVSGSAFDAWGDIIEGMYHLAVDAKSSKNPMAAVAAARFLGMAAGFYSERGGPVDNGGESDSVDKLRAALRAVPVDKIRLLIEVTSKSE